MMRSTIAMAMMAVCVSGCGEKPQAAGQGPAKKADGKAWEQSQSANVAQGWKPGDQAASHTVQLPADVDGELQRLGARQQHAEVERAGEMTLVEPAPPLDHLAVHDRDLAGGPAERDEAELQPEARGFAEGRSIDGRGVVHPRPRTSPTRRAP